MKKTETKSAEVLMIPIAKLARNTYNPRKIHDQNEQEEFEASIKANGILQAILVRPKNSRFEVVAGERRYSAAEKAGIKEIPCLIREMDDKEAYKFSVMENMSRANMNPADEAEAVRRIVLAHGKREAAKVFGKSVQWVSLRDQIAQMPPTVVQMIRDGALTLAHCDELAVLASEDQIEVLAKDAVRSRMTVAELRKKVRDSLRTLENPVFSTADKYEDADGLLTSCLHCVSRSDKQADLFGTSNTESLCLDGACWTRKLAAHIEQIKTQKKAEGFEVVPKNEEYWAQYGYGDYTRDKDEIAKQKADGVKPWILINDKGEIVECWKEQATESAESEDSETDTDVEDEDDLTPEEIEARKQQKAFGIFIELATEESAKVSGIVSIEALLPYVLDTIQADAPYSVLDRELAKLEDVNSMLDSGISADGMRNLLVRFLCERYLRNKEVAPDFLDAMGIDRIKVMKKAVKKSEELCQA